MRKTSKAFFSLIRRHKVWSTVIGLIIVCIIWYFYSGSSENAKYTEVSVVKSSISEIVSVTGNVKPLSSVDLALERGGRVASIAVAVGDKVYTGQHLIGIANADLTASLEKAQADLKIAELQLGKNISGNPKEIADNSKLNKATLDLAQAKTALVNALKDSYTKADDALRNKIYSLFTDPVKYGAKLSFSTNTFLKEDIEDGKEAANDNLDRWYRSLASLNNSADFDTYYVTSKTNLSSIKSLLVKCAEAVNGLTPDGSYVTQTQIDTWKTNISSARTSIDLEISTLIGVHDNYQTAVLALKTAETDFSVQAVTVDQAKASVASAEAELAKTVIRSPITGIVSSLDVKLGEIVSANKNIISVISYGDYEAESFVPEADISKVKIGDKASTTLDAYGSSVNFETVVIKIDPAATVIDGVPTYKITLKFNTKDERIRSGMTANLDILTNQKDGVLILPSRVTVSKDDGKYVSVRNPDDQSEIVEKKIVTGLRGSDGNVEIVSGLNEGESVVLP